MNRHYIFYILSLLFFYDNLRIFYYYNPLMLNTFFQEKRILFLLRKNIPILKSQYFYNLDYCIHYLKHS